MNLKEFNLEIIGKKIRHLLIDKDLTITLLADSIGISRQGLYNKINNNTWTVSDIYKVATVLGIDPKDLISD